MADRVMVMDMDDPSMELVVFKVIAGQTDRGSLIHKGNCVLSIKESNFN